MALMLDERSLVERGLEPAEAARLLALLEAPLAEGEPSERWRRVSALLSPEHPFAVHQLLHEIAYVDWDESRGPAPTWFPEPGSIPGTNLGRLMADRGVARYEDLHRWSVERRGDFWKEMIGRLGIRMRREPDAIVDPASSVETPRWLPGAELNIAESCFQGEPDATAVVFQRDEGGPVERMSLGALERLTDRVAHGLVAAGLRPGDAVGIDMPMTAESVALYLGIVKAGLAAVGIADSFAPQEIATRLRIAGAKAIVTQDVIPRGGKSLPLYAKVVEAGAPRAWVVAAAGGAPSVALREGDAPLDALLAPEGSAFRAVPRRPEDVTNVLFSSGTTGDPKAIPWTHVTPIKAAADGWLHHDIRPGDVVAWPTSLGWMMGPWLIYASLLNRAAMALCYGPPGTAAFGRFVRDARVTMLGLVPSLVKAWRESGCLAGIDWSGLRAMSSTGESSNAVDYHWLAARACYRPVIEYCGGTEIGGGYITGTVVQPQAPAAFSTPAMGLDLVVLDEQGRPADSGEVCIVPPSFGLSNELLNADHHKVYFEGMPAGPRGELLRRHGDQIEILPGSYYRAHGRVDDTMNLGGIKVSSAEIERALVGVAAVRETAAIAVPPPGGGPSLLVIFAVPLAGEEVPAAQQLRAPMQAAIRELLNPLFKIHDVVVVDQLPRTASNKVMRRLLRDRYRPAP